MYIIYKLKKKILNYIYIHDPIKVRDYNATHNREPAIIQFIRCLWIGVYSCPFIKFEFYI